MESLRATQSSQWTCSHSFSFAWRSHTEKGGLSWRKQHNFVIFLYISTELGDDVYIWLFYSHVKFHAKICTDSWNINKSHRGGYFFCVHPVDCRRSFMLSLCNCSGWECNCWWNVHVVLLIQYPGDCQSRFQQWFPLNECSSADGSALPSAFRSEQILCFCFTRELTVYCEIYAEA